MARIRMVKLPAFGRPERRPESTAPTHRARLQALAERMGPAGFDVLVVYADREHFANLAWLTGFDPRFEEAVLLLDRAGHGLLLVGNECMGYLPDPAIGLEVERFPEFSLLGQTRDGSRPLRDILAGFGIRRGTRVGGVDWKYYSSPLLDEPETAMTLPAYLADLLRRLTGRRELVRNATGLLMNPVDGLRVILTADDIAQLEFAATRTSESVLGVVRHLRPGVREWDLDRHFRGSGLPCSCHPMVSFGAKAARGLSSPSERRARLGDAYTTAYGVWGSLTARAGVVAATEADLPADTREFYVPFVKNYFDVVATWYRQMKVGARCGAVWACVEAARDKALYTFCVNPGHYIHLDEWVHSPFARGSRVALRSGMALQMDIIPVSRGPFCCANAEDGVALADAGLRAEIAACYPGCWRRMEARRVFMAEQLGIALDPSVLPLGNIPAWLPPFALDPHRVLTAD